MSRFMTDVQLDEDSESADESTIESSDTEANKQLSSLLRKASARQPAPSRLPVKPIALKARASPVCALDASSVTSLRQPEIQTETVAVERDQPEDTEELDIDIF